MGQYGIKHGKEGSVILPAAGVNQGLITYHFKNKETLWRAADSDQRMLQRNIAKAYVRFVARRPELLRFIVEEGKQPSKRVRWLVDTYLKPMYEYFPVGSAKGEAFKAHYFYAMTGSASLIFSVRPVCKRLTGLDPLRKETIEAHAEFVAGLLVP